jgi:hypothetical protein
MMIPIPRGGTLAQVDGQEQARAVSVAQRALDRRERFEHEHSDGQVGVDVVIAHGADHLASR